MKKFIVLLALGLIGCNGSKHSVGDYFEYRDPVSKIFKWGTISKVNETTYLLDSITCESVRLTSVGFEEVVDIKQFDAQYTVMRIAWILQDATKECGKRY